MSKSLVKQALELCKDDEELISSYSSKKISMIKSKKSSNSRLKKTDIYNKKGKQAKNLIEKYCQLNNKNNLDENLVYLKKISRPVINYSLIKEALGDLGSTGSKKQEPEQKEESIFTEKDFKDFEKSYFKK